jgi:hypothetical protein
MGNKNIQAGSRMLDRLSNVPNMLIRVGLGSSLKMGLV